MVRISIYRADYNNNPPSPISFIPTIVSTSGRLHSEFVFLLFLQAHRETDRFLHLSNNLAERYMVCVHFEIFIGLMCIIVSSSVTLFPMDLVFFYSGVIKSKQKLRDLRTEVHECDG
jgi:hypothetical protein